MLPVSNPQFNTLAGHFNSSDPSGGATFTNNWLSITNFDDDDSLSGEVEIYLMDGTLFETHSVSNLPSNQRQDIPLGHPHGAQLGTWIFTPDDPTTLYDAVLVRYFPNADGFNSAFASRGVRGVCSGEPIQLSTMGNGATDNYIEIGNVMEIPATVRVDISDRFGTGLSSQEIEIPAKNQVHIYASDIIDPPRTGNVGSARVICEDPTTRLIVASTFYGHLPGSLNLEWSYASLATGITPVNKNSEVVAPVNTFLGMSNWFKIGDATGSGGSVDFSLFDFTGEMVAEGVNELSEGGTVDLDIHSMMGPDNVGSIVQTTDGSSTEFTGEILRVSTRSTDLQIGGIIPIRGIVKQSGEEVDVEGGGNQFIGDPNSLSAYKDDITEEEARRLLSVTTFGATQDEIDEAVADGLNETVERLTTVVSVPRSVRDEANSLLDGDLEEDDEDANTDHEGVQMWWLTHILKSPNTLKEKMAVVLHDRLATSCTVLDNGLMMDKCREHIKLIRDNAFGNYKELLQDMTKDFLMLIWLNGRDNQYVPGFPTDQNYAREHWELFSTGAPEKAGAGLLYPLYTPDDIQEAARAFTGWQTDFINDSFGQQHVVLFNSTRHDPGTKTLWEDTPYETSGEFDWEDMTDVTFDVRWLDVGRYLFGAMFSTFCHDHPSDALKNQGAEMLKNADWELKPVLRAILKSEACHSVDAAKTRVKNPLDHAIGFLKTTGIPMRIDRLRDQLENMGMELTNPIDVFGFTAGFREKEHYETEHWNAYHVEYDNFMTEAFRRLDDDFPADGGGSTFDACSLNPSPTARSDELVDHLLFLTGIDATPSEREEYIRFLDNRLEMIEGEAQEVPNLYTAELPEHCRSRALPLLGILYMNPKSLML